MKTDSTTQLLSNMLDISRERQGVLSQNLANANTPEYIRQNFDFEKALSDAAKSGNSSVNVKDYLSLDEGGTFRIDGNNVNISRELADMSQNSVFHSLAARAYDMRIKILKSAIR